MLHTPQVDSIEDYWCFNAQFDASEIETYAREWMAYDVWAEGARNRGLYAAEGLTCADDALVERRTFRRSAFFHDFLRRNDIDRMVTINLHRDRNRHLTVHTQLSVFRGVGQEAFSTANVEFLERLKPHLLVAVRTFCSLRQLLAFNAIAEHVLEGLATALFSIDRLGRLMYANRTADHALRDGEWLARADGKLATGNGIRNARACTAALKRFVQGIGSTMMLEHGVTGRQRMMLMTPVGPESASPAALSGRPAGLVWLLPHRPAATVINHMAQLFALTPAEARLLAQLARGETLKAAAEQVKISTHTARNQLKAILRKSGRRSQSQILAFVNQLAPIVADSEAHKPTHGCR